MTTILRVRAPTSNEIEAANRAEACAILIRLGYRVYRPEADCYGEDLIVRDQNGELHSVQLKSRPTVDWKRYGEKKQMLMLFPDPSGGSASGRKWYLVPHNLLYRWMKKEHGHAPKWNDSWSDPTVSKRLGKFLKPFVILESKFRGIIPVFPTRIENRE